MIINKISLAIAIFMSFSLVACGSSEKSEFLVRRASMNHSVETMRSALTNATLITQDPNYLREEHGTQSEYHAPDGKSYLWYPGNRNVVVGRWKVQKSGLSAVEVCYQYGPNTFNPVTSQTGGQWSCSKRFGDTDFIEGNLFNLKSGPVPFVIPDRGRYYPEHLVKWLGGDPTGIEYRDRRAFADEHLQRIEAETQ